MMGCNNKKYALLRTFSCTAGCYAPAGFAADPTAASGCSLQRRLVTDSRATDTATLATAEMTVLATLELHLREKALAGCKGFTIHDTVEQTGETTVWFKNDWDFRAAGGWTAFEKSEGVLV